MPTASTTSSTSSMQNEENAPTSIGPAWASVIAGVSLAAAALVDQLIGHWTARDNEAHYAPFGTVPDPAVLTTFMTVSALVFAACMYLAVRQARRSRQGRGDGPRARDPLRADAGGGPARDPRVVLDNLQTHKKRDMVAQAPAHPETSQKS